MPIDMGRSASGTVIYGSVGPYFVPVSSFH